MQVLRLGRHGGRDQVVRQLQRRGEYRSWREGRRMHQLQVRSKGRDKTTMSTGCNGCSGSTREGQRLRVSRVCNTIVSLESLTNECSGPHGTPLSRVSRTIPYGRFELPYNGCPCLISNRYFIPNVQDYYRSSFALNSNPEVSQ